VLVPVEPNQASPVPAERPPLPPCSTADAIGSCPAGTACVLNENDGLFCRRFCAAAADCAQDQHCVGVPTLNRSVCVPR
jgi:hypothetical protein